MAVASLALRLGVERQITGGGIAKDASILREEEHIRRMGVELPVSRLVVNQASALTAGGSLTNGFARTTTLGCGSPIRASAAATCFALATCQASGSASQ